MRMNGFVFWNITLLSLFHVVIISIDNCVGRDTSCTVKNFRLVYRDFVLSGNVVAAHKVKDVAICMWHCHHNDFCQSYNYQHHGDEEKLCEINNVALNVCPNKRLQKEDFAYYENVPLNQTYGSEANPALSCVDLQLCGYNTSGEYWFIYQGNILKANCRYENTGLNIALGKPTAQSSTKHASSKAVDGNRDTIFSHGSCTHTKSVPYPPDFSPWWRVDLLKMHFVRLVTITNRGDGCCHERLSNFEIRVGISIEENGNANPPCGGKYSLGDGETREISCDPPLLGRYVNIVIPGREGILTLCEVEVYE